MMDIQNNTIPDESIFSIFSGDNAELVASPFALFTQMRAISAVVPLPFSLPGTDHQVWMVTHMQEAVQVLKDQAHFTVDASSLDIKGPFGGRNVAETADTADAATFFTSKTMLTVDEPDHRRLRLLVSRAFTPWYIESLRPRVSAQSAPLRPP
jgi:cytochrome P450